MSHPPPYTARMKNIIIDHKHTLTSVTPSQIRLCSRRREEAKFFQMHVPASPLPRILQARASSSCLIQKSKIKNQKSFSLSLTPCFSKVWAAPPGPSTVSTVSYSDSNFVSIRALRVSAIAPKPLSRMRSSSPNQNSKFKNRKSLKTSLFQSISNLFKD